MEDRGRIFVDGDLAGAGGEFDIDYLLYCSMCIIPYRELDVKLI